MTNETRKGDWMQTYTGRQFWPMDPRPEDVAIEDIAHALSHQCRYAGHCRRFYSVAEHSILVSSQLPPELRLWGLLHDASEAYLVDVPRPVKPYLTGYREAEDRVMRAICERFDLPPEMPAAVKRVDNAILADEKAALMGPEPAEWHLPEPPLGIRIVFMAPPEATHYFMEEFKFLMAKAWS
ncbi:phosphohydrolase [Martelella soudanensis]|uniref:phosphohydrolase n=1 Tax=unclassified Martelella TaxID=2629616 RepID=UPI0015DD9212|nr:MULTISPECIES: phosphohydrolase [unclassified Martelella]